VLGESSLEVATTWLNLGGVLRAAGKLEEAESACRQCLDIRERQLGSQHTDTAAAQIGEHCSILCCVRPHEKTLDPSNCGARVCGTGSVDMPLLPFRSSGETSAGK